MGLNKKIGLGTVQFGTKYGISNTNGKTSVKEVTQILNFAEKIGIDLLDTAPAYGNAELILGENNLSNFKIVSKFLPPKKGSSIVDQFNLSISNLKIDSLYGYLAHRPQSILNDKLSWKKLLELKEKGVVNKIGYSLNNTLELKNLLKKGYIPDIIQIPFNLFDQRFKEDAILLKEKGCEIHTRSTFLQGLFFMDIKKLPLFFDSVKIEINRLQSSYKENLPSVLLNFVLNQNFIDYTIIGVENKRQLFQNINNIEIVDINSNLKISKDILNPSNWPII